jgi:hypothetical protein
VNSRIGYAVVASSDWGWWVPCVDETVGRVMMRVRGRAAGMSCVTLALWLAGVVPAWAAHWTLQSLPSATGSLVSGPLASVSCTSSRFCIAVGTDGPVGASYPVGSYVARWNGSAWTAKSLANPPGLSNFDLASVSCTSPRFCIAVGGPYGAYAERWNGSDWSLQRMPPRTNNLVSVSCASRHACVAVGDYHEPHVESWNGSRWSLQRADGAPPLFSVSCAAASACAAVGAGAGQQSGGFGPPGTTGIWNGRRWGFQVDTAVGLRTAVSCSSAIACTAVPGAVPFGGLYVPGDDGGALAEYWDGRRWSSGPVVNVPPVADEETLLNAISCSSNRSCTAVGSSIFAEEAQVTLAEHWNGRRWSIQPTPNPANPGLTDFPTGPVFNAVSCTSTRFCIAVGTNAPPTGVLGRPLAERYS